MNIREVVANLRLFHKHCTYPRSDMVTGTSKEDCWFSFAPTSRLTGKNIKSIMQLSSVTPV